MSFRDDPIPTRAPAWRWPLAYVLTLVVFLAMDAVWLSLSSGALYQPAIGHLMAPAIDWRAVAVFYPLYVGGLVFFAVAPARSGRPVVGALGRGALFGVLAYATYDFTNQATLRDWPWHVTFIDLVWGTTVSGVSAAVASALTAVTCRRAIRTSGR
ncbi:DUF2177 family protein [Roseateles sp.]|uniref:DUF2177 family protein n=1 Tax=Roseateles sp. TaxID=1971397 RepID=UPI002F4138D6